MFGAHSAPVTTPAPALASIVSVPDSRVTRTIAAATPECTGPTITSTFSRLTSRLVLSVALAGFASLSTCTYSIVRPPSLPPFSSTCSLNASVIALPSWA